MLDSGESRPDEPGGEGDRRRRSCSWAICCEIESYSPGYCVLLRAFRKLKISRKETSSTCGQDIGLR